MNSQVSGQCSHAISALYVVNAALLFNQYNACLRLVTICGCSEVHCTNGFPQCGEGSLQQKNERSSHKLVMIYL